jgi:hypothetical protein
MKDNISIFNSEVRVPPATRDFNLIPSGYRDWYINLFEKGKRDVPPGLPQTIGPTSEKTIVINSTDNFEITEIARFDREVLFYGRINGIDVYKIKDHAGERVFINVSQYSLPHQMEIMFTHKNSTPVAVGVMNNKLICHSLETSKKITDFEIEVIDFMIRDNHLYARSTDKFFEIELHESGNKIIPTASTYYDIMPHATELHSGIAVENILGKYYVLIPEGKNIYHTQVDVLEDWNVIDAKYDDHVAVFTCHNGAVYHRVIIRFNDNFSSYDVYFDHNIDYSPINFITLPQGVVVMITHDDKVLVFPKAYNTGKRKEIKDPAINSDMRLVKSGSQVRFIQGNKCFSMKMKNK